MEDLQGTDISQIRALNYSSSEKADWSPSAHKYHKDLCENQIFGVGFKRDKDGRPIEQGLGSPGNENENHFRSIGVYEGKDAEKAARAAAAARKKS